MNWQVWNWSWIFAQAGAAPAGEGVETTFVHTWTLPPWVTVSVLMVSAVLIIMLYVREQSPVRRVYRGALIGLRLVVISLVVLMMYGWMQHRYLTDLPDLVLVLDESGSMAQMDRYPDGRLERIVQEYLRRSGQSEATRSNLAKAILLQREGGQLERLREDYNLKLYTIGSTAQLEAAESESLVEPLQRLQPSEPASRLGDSLRNILEAQRGRPTAAVVLFTDGITTEGRTISEVAEYARRKQIPLYAVGLGNEQPPRDVRISDLLADELAFVGDLVNLDFKLTAVGYEGQQAAVRLRRAGSDTVLAERTVALPADGTAASARITHRPLEVGEWEYRVDVEPLEGEVDVENNRASALVTVRDETIRVLLVQDYPSLEFRFLKMFLERALKRSGQGKAFELTTILQEADLEYAAQDPTAQRVFPVRREDLFRYDVLIFGDVNPAFLSQSVMENIDAFVKQRGGGVVFLAGPRHTPLAYRETPLANLFPVQLGTVILPDPDELLETGFPVQPTALGLSSPPMQLEDTPEATARAWQRLPSLYWFCEAPDLRAGARVLAVHPTRTASSGRNLPVILLQYVGAGQVVLHLTDETWRWARVEGSPRYYERYWMQLIRSLSRAKLLGSRDTAELTSDREAYERGDAVRLRARFFDDRAAPAADDGVTVVLEREGGKRRQVVLRRDRLERGIFEGLVSDLPEGQYRAWLATPSVEGQPPSRRFSVVAPPGEQARLEMNAEDLRKAAEISQGRFYTIRTAQRLFSDLPRGRQVRLESLPPEPIWNSPWLAGLFVGLLISEWLLRKRAGML